MDKWSNTPPSNGRDYRCRHGITDYRAVEQIPPPPQDQVKDVHIRHLARSRVSQKVTAIHHHVASRDQITCCPFPRRRHQGIRVVRRVCSLRGGPLESWDVQHVHRVGEVSGLVRAAKDVDLVAGVVGGRRDLAAKVSVVLWRVAGCGLLVPPVGCDVVDGDVVKRELQINASLKGRYPRLKKKGGGYIIPLGHSPARPQ